MLTLTPAAAEVVRQLVTSSSVDENGGMRISFELRSQGVPGAENNGAA
jgi:hypothetical protein